MQLSVPVLLVVFGSFWWLSDLSYLITTFFPEDKSALDMLDRLMQSGIVTIITICIIAPFLEEMLFRGIILRGFLAHYPADKAILLSSLIFAIIHLNIYQIPTAFVIGCFLGWLFYTSKSLWPCILTHAIFNAGAYVFYHYHDVTDYHHPLVNAATFLISMSGIYLLNNIFRTAKQQTNK